MNTIGTLTSYHLAVFIHQQVSHIKWRMESSEEYHGEGDGLTIRLFRAFSRDFPAIVLKVSQGAVERMAIQPKPHISQVPLGRMLYFFAPVIRLFYPHFIVPTGPRTQEERDDIKLHRELENLFRTVSARIS